MKPVLSVLLSWKHLLIHYQVMLFKIIIVAIVALTVQAVNEDLKLKNLLFRIGKYGTSKSYIFYLKILNFRR